MRLECYLPYSQSVICVCELNKKRVFMFTNNNSKSNNRMFAATSNFKIKQKNQPIYVDIFIRRNSILFILSPKCMQVSLWINVNWPECLQNMKKLLIGLYGFDWNCG